MMNALMVGLVALATYRLTRLVTADAIMQPLRDWVANRGRARLTYLVACDWCLSIWIAPVPTFAAVLWPTNRLVIAVLVALGASALTGLVSLLERRMDAE